MLRVNADDHDDWRPLDAEAIVAFHSDGDRAPLILIRTWTDELQGHAHLAAALGDGQPLVSIAAPMTPDDFPRSVDEWADRVIEGVWSNVDPGHALLGGFSFGGVVALEVADRIRAEATRPEQVVLLDSSVPRPKKRSRPTLPLAGARRVVRILEDHRAPAERAREFGAAAVRLPRVVIQRTQRQRERRRKRIAGGGRNEPEMPYRQRAIWIAYLKYEPVPLDLPGAVLATTESIGRAKNDCSLGWSRVLAGPLRAEVVDGGHFTLLEPSNVGSSADAIACALASPQPAIS